MKRLFCEDMTKTEALIADTIIDNIDQMEFLGIEELARLALVSNAMVVKYSKKIGFSGFKELKYYILATRPTRIEKCNVYSHYQQQKVNDYYNYIKHNKEVITELVNELYSSNHIVFVSNGATYKIAQYYQDRLAFTLGTKVDLIQNIVSLEKSLTDNLNGKLYVLIAADIECPEILKFYQTIASANGRKIVIYENGEKTPGLDGYKLCERDINYSFQFSQDRILFFLYFEMVLNELMLRYSRKMRNQELQSQKQSI